MKTINSWQDLRPYGIDVLTAESCGLSYRYLCDVTEQGKKAIEKLFDVELKLAENWNSGAIGSIMLPPDMLVPLGIFALLESGCTEVWANEHACLGIEDTDDDRVVEVSVRHYGRCFAYKGTAGSRNVHLMSGRTT
jgi:hypothetical protein